ncbi:MAG: NifU family protein [Aureispira sp.]|nr:NifU family protein [Aureispira sp.]
MDKEAILKRVEEALDSIRPHLKEDGGNIEVVEITDDLVAKVKWVGTCETCSMSPMTMKGGIEYTIKNQVPEITGIEPVNGTFVS